MLYYIPNNLLTDVPEGVKAAWDLPMKCQGGRPGFVFELTDDATYETVLTLADFVANSCNPSVPTPVMRVVLPNRQMIVIIGGGTEGYRYYDLHPANAFDDLKCNGKKVRNATITIECGIEAVAERFADAWNKVTRRAVLCSKALGEGVEELNGRLESLLEVRNAIELSLEFAKQSAPDDDQQSAEPQSETSEPVETVVVEPVEVEHDGVVDVELAETSETIPVVEAEPAAAEPRAALYRSTCDSAGNDYTLVVDGSGLSARDAALFVADYVLNNIRPNFRNEGMESAFRVTTVAHVRVMVKICGVGGVRTEVEYHRREAEVSYRCFSVWAESADYFGKAARDGGVTDAWDRTLSFARGIEIALKRDKLIHKHDGNECAALIETYDEAIEYKDASKYVERVVSLPVGGFIEPGASGVPGVPSEPGMAVSAEPRAVESAPTLPAECSAETVEIPEVPPQTNGDAQVLQVAEHVIPACVTLKEYELTRDVPRKRCKQFRDARGRKCAYVVRADSGAFILWRDWYEHDDAELDATVRAYYAQVA